MQTQNQTAGALPQIPGWRTAQNAQAPNHSWWPTWQGWGTLPWRRQPRAYPGATQGQPLPPGPTAQRRGPRPPPPLNRTAPGQRHAPPAAIQNAYNWQHRQGPAPQREQAHTPQTTAPQQTTIFYPGAVPNGPAVHTVPVTNQTRAPDPAAATVQNNVLSVPPVHPATHRPAPTYPRTTPVQDNVLRVPPVHPGTERPPAHQAAALTPNQAAAPMPTRAAKVYPTVRPRPVTPYPAPAMLYHAPTPYHSWPSHLPPGNQQAHGHNHHGAGGHRDNKRHPHFDDGNDRGHRILFHDKRKPHYGFTNLSKHNVFYDGKLYPTSEHLFQALKVRGRGWCQGGEERGGLMAIEVGVHLSEDRCGWEVGNFTCCSRLMRAKEGGRWGT